MQPSPYRDTPTHLQGRDDQLRAITEILIQPGLHDRAPRLMHVDLGGPGMGKTTLLARAADDATLFSLRPVRIETTARGLVIDLREALADALGVSDHTESSVKKTPGQSSTSAQMPDVAAEDSNTREAISAREAIVELLREAAAAALSTGHMGVVLLIDNLDRTPPADAEALADAWVDIAGSAYPVAVFAAADPSLAENAPSFALSLPVQENNAEADALFAGIDMPESDSGNNSTGKASRGSTAKDERRASRGSAAKGQRGADIAADGGRSLHGADDAPSLLSVHALEPLRGDELHRAFTQPADKARVTWQIAALQEMSRVTGGIPGEVVRWGTAMWEAAGSPDPGMTISAEYVEAARAALTRSE